jgi:hypothetical protein
MRPPVARYLEGLDHYRGENEGAGPHRVPFSHKSMEISRDLERDRQWDRDYIFAGQRQEYRIWRC